MMLVLYGFIALGTGALGITARYDSSLVPFADNSHRFMAAIWASTALAFFYTAWKPEEVALFRFLMIALFIGGVVRSVACVNYTPDAPILITIFLEIVPPPLLWWVHAQLLKNSNIS